MFKNKKIKLFEAFAWIWSQHQALLNLWFKVDIIWISDWYTDAIIAYWLKYLNLKPKKIDKTKILLYLSKYSLSLNSKIKAKNLWWLSNDKLSILCQVVKKYWNLDIKNLKWENFIWKNIDLFTYSFPCQDISQQWKQKWFSRWTQSRSWLLWEVERILKEVKNTDKKSLPKILMMENVKAILNRNFKGDLDLWINELNNLWYKSTKPFVINAKDLWEAQNRERVFMLSFLEKNNLKDFKIEKIYKDKYIKDIYCKNLIHEKFITNRKFKIIEKDKHIWIKKAFLDWYSNFNAENYVYYLDWKSPTITASGAHSRVKFFDENKNIIYLNAFEHLKLQWFNDEEFYKKLVKIWLTENKIKFLAWNSINIKVLEEIFSFYLL